jgi:hypothetical protein
MPTKTPNGYMVDAESEDTVGANEDTLYVTGNWLPPEPEVGVNTWGFEITDIRNENNISVLELITDESWLIATELSIAKERNAFL